MKHFQIKVCGITRVLDAVVAADLGADMIGMVFCSDSPRTVSSTCARAISAELNPIIDLVGVFRNAEPETILRVTEKCRIKVVQLHGLCHAADIWRLQRSGLVVIQAFRVNSRGDWKKFSRSKADLMMIDNSQGFGVRFDPALAPPRPIPNLVLSGGVAFDNVAHGVARFRPCVVDVNSSVETKPGIKSKAKLRRFFGACNELRYGK